MTTTQTGAEQLISLHGLDRQTYERMLGRTLHEIRESLDERISRDQRERVLLSSEAHPSDLLEAIQHLAACVLTDEPCPTCGDFDCTEAHGLRRQTWRQFDQYGFSRWQGFHCGNVEQSLELPDDCDCSH